MVTSFTQYAGLFVCPSRERPGHYIITDAPKGGCNMAPGALFFPTEAEALRGIDILRVVDGDGSKFHHLWSAIKGHSA